MAAPLETDENAELDLNGKNSKANLVKLLEILTVQLKTVFLRNQTEVETTLAKYGD